MTSNIIAESFPATGPMYQRLPNELIWEIIKHLLLLPPVSRPGVIVDKKRFDILNALPLLLRIRSVNKMFAIMAMQAFYLANDFTFKAISYVNNMTPWCTSLAPALPPARLRSYLRRVQVHIVLEDFFTITAPGGDMPASRYQVLSVDMFFAVSRGARLLRDLTSALGGFANLDFLDLHIYTDFRFEKHAALKLVRQAAFVVRARCVEVVVEAPAEGEWCPEVAELVAVEGVE